MYKLVTKFLIVTILFLIAFVSCKKSDIALFKSEKVVVYSNRFSEKVIVNNKKLLDYDSDLGKKFLELIDKNHNQKSGITVLDIIDVTTDLDKDESADNISITQISDETNDVTDDKKNTEVEKKDLTTDSYIRKNYIFDKIRIKEIGDYQKYFSESTLTVLKEKLSKYNLEFVDSTSDQKQGYSVVTIEINKYNIGEFNLIKNTPTLLVVVISFKNDKHRINHKIKKTYRVNSTAEFPNEQIRLSKISSDIYNDIERYLVNVFIKNTIVTNKNKKDKTKKTEEKIKDEEISDDEVKIDE